MTPPRAATQRLVRRTQEERSAETRSKVIRAAAECLAELGFKGATMSAIAERAGVTWGAMQHHFGDKNAILDAVLESALAELEAGLSDLDEVEPEIEKRVRAFIPKADALLRGPGYRAFVEIQLNRARDEAREPRAEATWSEQVAGALARVWKRAFGDLGIAPRKLQAARRFSFMVLSGIAAETMLFPGFDFSRQHLRILEENLLRMLSDRA